MQTYRMYNITPVQSATVIFMRLSECGILDAPTLCCGAVLTQSPRAFQCVWELHKLSTWNAAEHAGLVLKRTVTRKKRNYTKHSPTNVRPAYIYCPHLFRVRQTNNTGHYYILCVCVCE